ncbi:MAG: zinc-ribbon domain-containing protein [Ruminococcus sp.]|nr:zinc-ribbon domain-containing protein [Ruminococcus sp.]
MFCPYCGKDIVHGSKFCIQCGKEVLADTNIPQPLSASIEKPLKKRKPWIGVIIGVAAFLVSTAIIAPIVANSYTKNNTENTPTANYTFPTFSVENEIIPGATVSTKEYYSEVTGTISSTIMLISRGDEIITISGNFFLSDLSVSEFDDVKYNFSTMQEIVKNNNVENILIDINETAYSYTITFSFTNLNYENGEVAAKTAADLLGFNYSSGKIKLSDAESTLLANGYILKAEY